MNTKVKVDFVWLGIKSWKVLVIEPQNIFFTDDVVEILNLTDEQKCGCAQARISPNIIGYRYKIETRYSWSHSEKTDDNNPNWKKDYVKIAKVTRQYQCRGLAKSSDYLYFDPNQFRLYHRSMKNWLKYIWLLLTKIYL